jgi:hypothetical protein
MAVVLVHVVVVRVADEQGRGIVDVVAASLVAARAVVLLRLELRGEVVVNGPHPAVVVVVVAAGKVGLHAAVHGAEHLRVRVHYGAPVAARAQPVLGLHLLLLERRRRLFGVNGQLGSLLDVRRELGGSTGAALHLLLLQLLGQRRHLIKITRHKSPAHQRRRRRTQLITAGRKETDRPGKGRR